MAVTNEQILEALKTVDDPELHKDLVTLGMIDTVAIDGASVSVTVALTTPACPMKTVISENVRAAVAAIDGVSDVDVKLTSRQAKQAESHLPGVRQIIAVGAGKGGVGKSTMAVNLAVALAREGASVGVLDADVFGPSVAAMLGLEGLPPLFQGEQLHPFEACGIKAMSMATFAQPNQAMVWRGPMVHQAIMQLITQVQWGELDYLVIDLPPGTGDVPLTLAQALPITGAVVVSTPQKLAIADTVRAVGMYRQLKIDILGVIENMSYFVCNNCQVEHDLFSRGGAADAAAKLGIALLGEVPIYQQLGADTDAGRLEANFATDNPAGKALATVATNLRRELCAREAAGNR